MITPIPKPNGEAGGGAKGFSLQWAMDLVGDDGGPLYGDILVGVGQCWL